MDKDADKGPTLVRYVLNFYSSRSVVGFIVIPSVSFYSHLPRRITVRFVACWSVLVVSAIVCWSVSLCYHRFHGAVVCFTALSVSLMYSSSVFIVSSSALFRCRHFHDAVVGFIVFPLGSSRFRRNHRIFVDFIVGVPVGLAGWLGTPPALTTKSPRPAALRVAPCDSRKSSRTARMPAS